MNCKPGDLAVILRALWPENVGRLVTVIRLHIPGVWLTEGHGPGIYCDDADLLPIRPQPDDAIDEVIQRIGTPHKEVA